MSSNPSETRISAAIASVARGRWGAWVLESTHPPVLIHARTQHRVVARPPANTPEELVAQLRAAVLEGAPDVLQLTQALHDLALVAGVQALVLTALADDDS